MNSQIRFSVKRVAKQKPAQDFVLLIFSYMVCVEYRWASSLCPSFRYD